MAAVTLNISLSAEQVELIDQEVDSGQYTSASEVVREALRLWLRQRIEADVAALEKAHAGAWQRDATDQEKAEILLAKRESREEHSAGRQKRPH
jgi:putative addiction module CopG family antidote